jgi:hypothetical protein
MTQRWRERTHQDRKGCDPAGESAKRSGGVHGSSV